jgi:hypothetical protein
MTFVLLGVVASPESWIRSSQLNPDRVMSGMLFPITKPRIEREMTRDTPLGQEGQRRHRKEAQLERVVV